MSDTCKRIISGIVLIAITGGCIYSGRIFIWGWTAILGILMLDEVLCNFFKGLRSSRSYFFAQLLNITLCLSFPFWQSNKVLLNFVVVSALLINILLLVNLIWKIDLLARFKEKPVYTAIILTFPLLALGSIIYGEKWMVYFCTLLLITIGMDSGAWFFGKLFGRRKFWPEVSPNKTLEGVLGGCLVASLFSGIFWYNIEGSVTFKQVIFLTLCGLLSQMGDLVQSKFKREYNVKDSSALIPGHGGIYDRLDSVVFLAPFFTLLVEYL